MYVKSNFNTNSVVFNLVIINVLMFLLVMVSGNSLWPYLALYAPTSENFLPTQLLSHFFLHIGFMHLLFNMIGLVMLGATLEKHWGAARFLFYYMACGMGAAVCFVVARYIQYGEGVHFAHLINNPMLGASGAVSGLLIAFGMLWPNSELVLFPIPMPIKAKYFVIGYALIEIALGMRNNSTDHVAHFAHLGGMLIGFILIMAWKKTRNNFY